MKHTKNYFMKNKRFLEMPLSNYKQEWIYTDGDQQVVLRYTTLQHGNKTIIATYSEKRAHKDRHDRERLLKKAQSLLARPELLKKKASRHFIKQTGDDKYELNIERIKQQEKYDGFLAIATNNTTLATTDVLDQYKQLFKIEHTFRTFKSHLETRPMFHWTDRRIEGHICLCYIAYTLQHWVLLQLKNFPIPITENILREMLDKMEVSLLLHNEQKVYLRSTPHQHEIKLQQHLGLKPLSPILPEQRLFDYL